MAPFNDKPPLQATKPSMMPLEVEEDRKPSAHCKMEGKSSSSSEEKYDDVISISIREGTRGLALVSVVAVSTCMAVNSFLLLLQYEAPVASPPTGQEDQTCGGDGSNLPLWASLMQTQIQVIQNLVHASLLGGAAFVAAFRGDAVWLFFARNCCFFFGLAALSYLAVDISKGSFTTSSFIMSALMSTACIAAFVPLELARQAVATHVARYARGHEANYPKWLPSTRSQLVRTLFITRMSHCVEVVAIVYTILTTAAAILEDCDSETSVSLLETSYREGAHQAFLLSLLFHASTSPGDDSRLGGAIVCSGWRLLLGVSYLFPLPQTFAIRETASTIAIIVEILLMLPILVAALLLLWENSQSTLWKTSTTTSNVQYKPINEDDMERDEENDDDETDDPPSDHNRRIVSLSMFQISKSAVFSPRQRRGSFVMWLSSACLLVGMTLECLLLLTALSTVNAPEVYQWGMHVAAMYLFCTHMSVNSEEVYSRARYLLAIACPAGSVIAAWQLWQLMHTTLLDHWTVAAAAAFLFGWRFLCGVGQCVGLGLLHTTERQDFVPDTGPPDELDRRLKRGWFVLFKVYLPTLIMFVAADGYFSTCSEALISPSTPGCVSHIFLLAKHWPGLGLFFHFGGLLFIFAADALSHGSYPPSLAISIFFAANVTILLAGDLVMGAAVAHGDGLLTVLFCVKSVWMMAVGWLWILLHRLWKLRIAELE